VADLNTRRVRTLAMSGLERLPLPGRAEQAPDTLPAVEVGQGAFRLTLDLHLPRGYHRSADAPAQIQVVGGEEAPVVYILPDEPLAVDIAPGGRLQVRLNVVVYYCREDQSQLCLIDDRAWFLPLVVRPEGPAEVQIVYPVRLPSGV
jgi:hypothetical protein